MRTYSLLHRLLDVPIALIAWAGLVIVWWARARRVQQERQPHACGR